MTVFKDRRVPWTPREEVQLMTHRQNGLTRTEIGQILGRTQGAIDQHVKKLRLDPAWRPNRRAHVDPIREGKPLDLGEGDARYVRAVLAQGGFRYTTRLADGRLVTVTP